MLLPLMQWNCALWLLMKNLGQVLTRSAAHKCTTKKLETLSKIIVVKKTTPRNIKCVVHPLRLRLWIGQKNSQKFGIYINEKGMYTLLFSRQQPKTKEFRKHCCNVMFPHVLQQFTNKMKEDHQQAIEEKDAALALLNDDNRQILHFTKSWQSDSIHPIWKRGIASTKRCVSDPATKMSRHHHPS